jgi:hypothetical protein
MMDSIGPVDDTAHWANIAAEELARALDLTGIGFMGTAGDEDGDVSVAFNSLADAEALMTLAVPQSAAIGGLYDRATSSCLTMASFAEAVEPPSDEQIEHAIVTGWTWTIHPNMRGRRMGWHVSVDIPAADANQVTANLNALRLGGAV